MKLNNKEIEKIAELARLKISDKDLKYYADELSGVLDYIEQLREINTDKVEPTSNVSGLDSVYRKDEEYEAQLKRRLSTPDVLMRLVPFAERGFVKVKSVFKAR